MGKEGMGSDGELCLATGAEDGTKPSRQPNRRSNIGKGLQWHKSKFS